MGLEVMLSFFEAQTAEQYTQARALLREYADWLGYDLDFQHFSEELAGLPGAYAPPGGRLLLATCDGALAGCVALRGLTRTVCEMNRLYVRPGFRHRGIGRRLAEDVIQAAGAAGYQRMRLDTLAHMEPARALYRLLGFRQVAPYYDNPLPGAIFFELDLSKASG